MPVLRFVPGVELLPLLSRILMLLATAAFCAAFACSWWLYYLSRHR
jgi:hypothetical protein